MAKIIIPANQVAVYGEFIQILISLPRQPCAIVWLKCVSDKISTQSSNETFESESFDKLRNGYKGINDVLEVLCKSVK